MQFLLQEENAKPGEYVVRARASQSWWPTRSISAEVNLEPGRYEVLPKISATRDLNKPIVEDVVKKAAEENPQKLRQIGLNYDIAHAKGGFAEEEETRKKKLAKEKKLKEDKLKEEMLKMKKAEEEKAETEKVATDGVTTEVKQDEVKPEKGDDEKLAEVKPDAETAEVVNEGGPIADAEMNEINEANAEKKVEGEMEQEPNANGDAKQINEEEPESENLEPELATGSTAKESPNPWNAVAVIGLRVYSKDPKLTVRLVKPKDPEEAAMLDIGGGVSGAGATT